MLVQRLPVPPNRVQRDLANRRMSSHVFPPSRQVLTNSDLLYCIFTSIPLTPALCDRCVARCATVCRAFYEPAIRVLWRSLFTMMPLWHILAPEDCRMSRDALASGEEGLEYLNRVGCVFSFATIGALTSIIRLYPRGGMTILPGGSASCGMRLTFAKYSTWPSIRPRCSTPIAF